MSEDELLPMPVEDRPLPELGLCIWPDPTLTAPVIDFPDQHLGSKLTRNTAQGMLDLMYNLKGIGLAAQQVSVPFRMFVMDAQVDGVRKPRIFLNPQITEVGPDWIQVNHPGEGCLSFPYGFRSPVPRHQKVELEWRDFDGNVLHEWFEDQESVIIQHEMDHLMGKCFIDRLSWMKRDLAIRKARRIRAQYKKGTKAGFAAMRNAPRTPSFNLKRLAASEVKEKQDETA